MYLWDLDAGFAGVVLIKKIGDGSKMIQVWGMMQEKGGQIMALQGCWDSIHVIEMSEKAGGRQAHYKLTSTVMLWLQTNKANSGLMNLGGSLTRQVGHTAGNPWE